MAEHGLAAYYIPYDSEGRREWVSGFTGSNGDAIVTNVASGDQVQNRCGVGAGHFEILSELVQVLVHVYVHLIFVFIGKQNK